MPRTLTDVHAQNNTLDRAARIHATFAENTLPALRPQRVALDTRMNGPAIASFLLAGGSWLEKIPAS